MKHINASLDGIVQRAGMNPAALRSGILELVSVVVSKDLTGRAEADDFFSSISDMADVRSSFHELADRMLQTRQNEQTEKNRSVTEKIVEYIDTGYMNNISLTDVSEKFNLNPNYVSDIFRKNTGITFKEYLTNTRMKAAKNLLKDTSYKIAGIAQMVGYNDVKNFSKIFKKYIGITPAEYRNLMGK